MHPHLMMTVKTGKGKTMTSTARAIPATRPHATVTVARLFEYPAERVFDAWLDPQLVGQWLFATPGGAMQQVDIDPRPHGALRIVERRDGVDVAHTGRYLVIDRPRRLSFSFAVRDYSDDVTRVDIAFRPMAQGCAVTLRHEGVWPDDADRAREGWTTILNGLDRTLRSSAA